MTFPTKRLLNAAWLVGASAPPDGVSPGGREENTGAASKFSDRLTMGSVEVISSDPLKLGRPNKLAIFCASCPSGNRVRTTLASTCPSVSLAVKVTWAAVAEGLA